MVSIDVCQASQAQPFLELSAAIDAQTPYMLLEAGERPLNAKTLSQQLAAMLSADDQRIFVAWEQSQPVGYVNVSRKPFVRVAHVFYLVLGVLHSHWGRGIGGALLAQAERWAQEQGAARMELTVLESNIRAVALYERQGYVVEGCRRNSMWVSGEYVNELYMGKLCPGP